MDDPFANPLLKGVRVRRLLDGGWEAEGPEEGKAEVRRLLAEGARYRAKKEEAKKTLVKRARKFPLGQRAGEDQELLFELADRVEELEKRLTKQPKRHAKRPITST